MGGVQFKNTGQKSGGTFHMKKLFKKYFLAKKKWRGFFPYKTWAQSLESV